MPCKNDTCFRCNPIEEKYHGYKNRDTYLATRWVNYTYVACRLWEVFDCCDSRERRIKFLKKAARGDAPPIPTYLLKEVNQKNVDWDEVYDYFNRDGRYSECTMYSNDVHNTTENGVFEDIENESEVVDVYNSLKRVRA